MLRIKGRITGARFASSFVLLLVTGLMAQDTVKRHPGFGNVPLYFEENRGQTDAQARYIARSTSLVGFVTQDGWTLSLHGQPISMHIAGANAKARFVPENSVEGITNYYLGSRAVTNLPHYSSVRGQNIRPGIDVIYHGHERELEYDLVVHPGADVDALWLRFDGSRPVLASNGDIVLKTSAGEVRQHKPRVWQEIHGRRAEVECRYVLEESGLVGFVLSNYDQSAELIVDPIISYSTYLGGTNTDSPAGVAVDASGYAYITGTTSSADFPVTFGTYHSGFSDVFVTKLNPSGTGLVYSTFIGGGSQDRGRAIALDNAGNAYVTGDTFSSNFPFTGGAALSDQVAFAVKLGTAGNIVYATALGGFGPGTGPASGSAIAVDASGSAYVAGNTFGTTFPVTPGSYKTTPAGGVDAFVAKLSAAGQISYATYLGGSSADSASAIAVDAAGNVFVGGTTSSSNFATTPGAYATAIAGGQDAFVVKLNPFGSALVYATFLGGSSFDSLNGLAIDAAGNCYVTGSTQSTDFPTTPGAFSPSKASQSFYNSGFVTKLSATGASLVYSTFLGGNNSDSAVAIAVDSGGSAYVAGSSQSSNFPTTPGALKTASSVFFYCCDYDMFLAKVSVDGSALSYSTMLGSSSAESAYALALDGIGGAYLLGSSQSATYPTTAGAYQTSNPKGSVQSSLSSVVISKIDFNVATLCTPSVAPQSQNLPGRGGAISFNLTLSPGCPWEALSNSTLLTLNAPKSGVVSTSPILITGNVLQNQSTFSSVTELVQIGTATFTVNQDAGSCQDPVISPSSLAFDSSGGIRNLSLTLPSNCAWVAVPGAPWLSVSNNPSGTGSASITIFTGPNSFSPRSTILTIAGKSITVTQSGSTCTATANIMVSSTSSQGGDGVASITTNSTACTWTAYAVVPWIRLNSSANTGQGSGFVPFILAPNPGALARTGQILIADVTLSVTQDAGPSGAISSYSASIVAGGGSSSIPNLGDGGPALGAYLNSLSGLAFDPAAGNLYIVDGNGTRIRVVTPDGNINTFAGTGSNTGENVPATSASLNSVNNVAVDSSSAVYINDSSRRIRRISQGLIVTFAGSSSTSGFSGDGGPATAAKLSNPQGIAADSVGNVYISDGGNGRIRKVSGGTIATFAGGGNNGLGDNGPATSAGLSFPFGVALDAAANLLIADNNNSRVRKIVQGNIATFAGGGSGGDGGPATSASLSNPTSLAVDPLGNVFFLDNGRIRKVSVDGTISSIANIGYSQGGLTADKLGDLYYSDYYGGVVRKLTPLPSFCSYSISTPPQIPPGGGSLQISVTTAAGCRWGVLLLPAWLTANGGTTGLGNGTITLTASPSAAARAATIAIGGMPVQVTQSMVNGANPFLSLVKTHVGNFSPGQQNAIYTITVSNAAGAAPTSGLVTVTDTLPLGLTPVAMSGSGWTCQSTTCTRSDVLNPGASYPAVTLTVNVANNATSPQLNQVNVTGGGSASASAADSTTITTGALSLNRQTLNFAVSTNGTTTGTQTVTVTFSGSGVAWTATSNQSNIVVLQGSGTGNGSFQVSGSSGPSGIVTVTAPGATGSPKQIQVNISNPSAGPPFGSFDTPADNTTGVAGALPVTGWALDAVEVLKVDVWREPVGAEPIGALVFIGDAVFVQGARPDVEALNPNVPFNYRAGWGYQMLTNFLPQGNGTFRLHAIAHNKTGASADLGTKTIVVDNAHSSKPFGTIDTPGQGGIASGNAYLNFGWALTQNPNKIPFDGSTISVVVDGQVIGHPTYNQFRSDIASLFPGYMNSGGAVGFFYLDTTKLVNGVHTISWNVFDSAGQGAGLGSRYFNVFNSGNGSTAEPEEPIETVTNHPDAVEIEELSQMEIPLGAVSGYQLVDGERRPLPIGSSLRRGVFYWQPGPGFLGEHNLVFEQQDGTEVQVKVRIGAKKYRQ